MRVVENAPLLLHFSPLPPPRCISLPLCLSSLLLQRHMALWHATHSILTSHIPWNTSALFLLVVPESQSKSPPRHLSHHPHHLHPPTPGAYPWASVAPTAESHKQPQLPIELSLLICLSVSHTGSICHSRLVCVGGREHPAAEAKKINDWRKIGNLERRTPSHP